MAVDASGHVYFVLHNGQSLLDYYFGRLCMWGLGEGMDGLKDIP